LEQSKCVLDVEASKEDCQQRSTSASVALVRDHHSQTGWLTPPLGSFSTARRMTVSSMMGSGPSWPCYRGPAGQPRVQLVPHLRGRLPAEPGARGPHGLLGAPGSGVAEDELATALGRPAALGAGQAELLEGGDRTPHHVV
jgi:hypothetical protein